MAAKDQADIIDGKLCLSSIAMQAAFGVTRATLTKWAKQGCPKSRTGWWPLADVIAWRGLGGSSKGKSLDDNDLSDLQRKLKYDADWKQQQAEALKVKNARIRDDLIPKNEIISTGSEHYLVIKRSFQGLSQKIVTEITPFVDPVAARRIGSQITEIVNDALTIISSGDMYIPPRRRIIKG